MIAEHIRQEIANLVVVSAGGTFGITVSIGASVLGGEDGGWEEAMLRADRAMYRAKGASRNAVLGIAPDGAEFDANGITGRRPQ